MSFLPNSAGMAMAREKTETAMTALNGTLARLTRRKMNHPGIARSREKAYHVRDALVSPAAPQKSWPIVAMMKTILAAHGSRAVLKISPTKPPASPTAASSVAAKRKASSTNQPISAEKKTERQTP